MFNYTLCKQKKYVTQNTVSFMLHFLTKYLLRFIHIQEIERTALGSEEFEDFMSYLIFLKKICL